MRGKLRGCFGALYVLAAAAPALAQDPLSAINWLHTAAPTAPQRVRPLIKEPPVARDATVPDVVIEVLGAPAPAAVGLLPASVTGYPVTLWAASSGAEVTDRITTLRAPVVPVLQRLWLTLLLAEAAPPRDVGVPEFAALRIERLLDLGAVEPASEMLRQAGPLDARLFRAAFDVALILDAPEPLCRELRRAPTLSDRYDIRVYCLARGGDWSDAVVTLESASALGAVDPRSHDLLARFLDPDLFEEDPLPSPSPHPDPLEARLFEAAGAPLPASAMPLAFATAALTGDAGWRAQIDAAERLVRAGVLSEDRLWAIYAARMPSASGGVWERVEAVQRFETALAARDPAAVGRALLRAVPLLREADLLVPFAERYGAELERLPLTGAAGAAARDVMLLGPGYERAARGLETSDPMTRFLQGLAQGMPDAALAETLDTPLALAVAEGFAATSPPADGPVGAGLLALLARGPAAADGDHVAVTQLIAGLRALALEDVARRASLQLLLSEAQ